MGIIIVQKSDPRRVKRNSTKAMILAGGAVTGGSFKAGGLKALNDYLVNFDVNEFDIYIGISSGSMLVAPLVSGLRPETILRSLDGTSEYYGQLTAWHYYRPNFEELLARPIVFAIKAGAWLPSTARKLFEKRDEWVSPLLEHVVKFIKSPSAANYESMMRTVLDYSADFPSLMSLIPTGMFDNRPIEEYIRYNIEKNKLTNSFKVARRITGKRLYICAVELDGAKPVVFGPDENEDLTISEAVMASTALPGFYKPARIHGVDYVDGMVHETANIDLAVKKGAKLIICYNPFRPFQPASFVDSVKREKDLLSRTGIFAVMYQIIRAAVYSRLNMSVERLRHDPKFKGDIILIEPDPHDVYFSTLNPLLLSNRVYAAQLGFESVQESIEEKYSEVENVLKLHGIKMSRNGVAETLGRMRADKDRPVLIQQYLEGRFENKT